MDEKETTNLDSNDDMVNYRQIKKNPDSNHNIVASYIA